MYNYKKHLTAGYNPYKRKNIYALAGNVNNGNDEPLEKMQGFQLDNYFQQMQQPMNASKYLSKLPAGLIPQKETTWGNFTNALGDIKTGNLSGAGPMSIIGGAMNLGNIWSDSSTSTEDKLAGTTRELGYTAMNFIPGVGTAASMAARLADKIGGGVQNALSGGYSSDIDDKIKSITKFIPGAQLGATALISAGLNRVYGSKLNQEKINEIQNQNADVSNQNTLGTTNTSLLNDFGNMDWGDEFTKSDVGKDASGKLFGIKVSSGGHKAEEKYNQLKQQQENARTQAMENFNNRVREVNQRDAHNALMNFMACGGKLFDDGGSLFGNDLVFDNNLMYINEGGTHEQSPHDGVPISYDEQGTPNLVEEGEVVYGHNYVFSDRLKVPDDIAKRLGITKGKTFAKAVRELSKESEELPNDPIIKRGLEDGLQKLAASQEQLRNEMQEIEYDEGGSIHINPANKGKFTASANAAGMGVQEFANHVLANKNKYSPTQVKRANFAKNSADWKYAIGGPFGKEISHNGYDEKGNPIYLDPTRTLEENMAFHHWSNNYANKMGKIEGVSRDYTLNGNTNTDSAFKITRDDGTNQFLVTRNGKHYSYDNSPYTQKINPQSVEDANEALYNYRSITNPETSWFNDSNDYLRYFDFGGNLFDEGGGTYYLDTRPIAQKVLGYSDSTQAKIDKISGSVLDPIGSLAIALGASEKVANAASFLGAFATRGKGSKFIKAKNTINSRKVLNSKAKEMYKQDYSSLKNNKRNKVYNQAKKDIGLKYPNRDIRKGEKAAYKEEIKNLKAGIKGSRDSFSRKGFVASSPYITVPIVATALPLATMWYEGNKELFNNKDINNTETTPTIQQNIVTDNGLLVPDSPSTQTKSKQKTATKKATKKQNEYIYDSDVYADNKYWSLDGNMYANSGNYNFDEEFLKYLLQNSKDAAATGRGKLGYRKGKTGDINEKRYKDFTDYIYNNWGNWGDNTGDVLKYLEALNYGYTTRDADGNLALSNTYNNANANESAKDFWLRNRTDDYWGRHHVTPTLLENEPDYEFQPNQIQGRGMSVLYNTDEPNAQIYDTIDGDTVVTHVPNINAPKKEDVQSLEPLEELPLDPLANLRYAPALGSVVNLMENKAKGPDFTYANQYDNLAKQLGEPITTPVDVIGDYRQRNPFDERYLVNLNNQNANAYSRTGQNISGGNRAAQLGYASAGNFQRQQNQREIMRQAYLANRQDDADVANFNKGTNTFNAQANNTRNNMLAQLNSQRNMTSLQGRMNAARLRQAIQDEYDTAINQDKMNIWDTLGNIGNETNEENRIRRLMNWGVIAPAPEYLKRMQKNKTATSTTDSTKPSPNTKASSIQTPQSNQLSNVTNHPPVIYDSTDYGPIGPIDMLQHIYNINGTPQSINDVRSDAHDYLPSSDNPFNFLQTRVNPEDIVNGNYIKNKLYNNRALGGKVSKKSKKSKRRF
ncbi:MAG: hypothetical protein J6N78_05475 [Clostridia bacterium]|nr:hypothetical protein [Clostridia bacterium]